MKDWTPPENLEYEPAVLLARYLAEYGVRNSLLEDLHAGKVPQSKTGDFSDVVVVTPDGEIPWKKLSRISDPEMRALMLNVEANLARCLRSIEEYEDRNALPLLLASIQQNAFGERGVTWDIPQTKWEEREANRKRLKEEQTDES